MLAAVDPGAAILGDESATPTTIGESASIGANASILAAVTVGLLAAIPTGWLTGRLVTFDPARPLIDEIEPVRRAFYGGAAGYFDFAGNMDFAITIRTALIREGVAHIQAGAGIVADSVPEREAQETRDKAAAMVRAVRVAARLERVQSR